ncbi:Ig-like domain-containing protein [Vibrio sp. Of7-15]|uniref:Ig-like domain-containing protein n=1 Tax=Vibrio sp. Of7-15 TaxID=2724879 RepID=UPI001EF24893|nr:Ig-like domain-containing protein [Vibrio sp. Of7-15]MCG7499320.1 Ig-like domain-containing protein [Vibrio sp. Of7-15]
MKKSLIYCALAACASVVPNAYAIDCSTLPIWQASEQYASGSEVQQNNSAYQAQWWSQGNSPHTHSGPWQEWKELGVCGDTGTNQPPTISVISPLNNASFSTGDNVVFNADASDSDGSIAQVQFLLNGTVLSTLTASPFRLNWTAIEGNHTLEVKATDNLNATSSASVVMTVTNATNNVPPTIQLTAPTSGSTANTGDSVMLAADASDSDGVVNQVDFYINDQHVGSDTSAPYEVNWTAVVGDHTIKAKATDNSETSTFSNINTITVAGQSGAGCAGLPSYLAGSVYAANDLIQHQNQKYRCEVGGWCSSDSAWAYEPGKGEYWQEAWSPLGACTTPPTVNITSPDNNSVVLAGSTVTIHASAADADGSVSQVEFFVGNSSLGIDTTAPYQIDWQATGIGETALKAIATDNDNNTANATALVQVSDQPLVISLTSPTTGSSAALGKAVTLEANATALNGRVNQVDFLVNGSVVASDTTSPYSAQWTPGSVGAYSISSQAIDEKGNSALSSAVTLNVVEKQAKKHQLIGYWHNFVNGSGCPIRLADISPAWDVIDIAFADNDRNSDGTVHFNLYAGDIHSTCPALDPVQFKQDVATLRAQGKIIVLSLGGAEGTITLNTDQDEINFVSSLTQIIKEWGFDGLDVDLESGSNLVHGSQIQARLPRALKQIEANTGGDMYLTMAPEHPYVQGGMIAYTGIWGAYIPLINELRDTLDLLHVQLYNNGGLPNPYMPGSAPEGSIDMMVASAKMLVEGFTLADKTQFAPLRDDQVAIGLPSGPSSANSGQAPIANITGALDCLTKRTSCETVIPASNYTNFGGVMTWSINWDQHDGYNFSVPVGNKLTQMNNK